MVRQAHHRRARILAVAATLIAALAATLVFRDTAAVVAWRLAMPRAAAALVRNDAALAFTIGNFYFNGGAYDLEAAGRAFRKARDIDAGLLGPRYQLSRIEFLKGNFYDALRLAKEELALHPEFKRTHYLLGLIYGYSGS